MKFAARYQRTAKPSSTRDWVIVKHVQFTHARIMRMEKVTIWHNPRCSKSRETLALLQSRYKEIRIIEYLKTPPQPEEIERALTLLRLQPRELIRSSEAAYSEHHLDNPELTRMQLIEAMYADPILIQRPVVFANGQACIGRPPGSVLDIL